MEYLIPDSPEKRAWQGDLLNRIAGIAMVEIEPPVSDYFAVYPDDRNLRPVEHMELTHPNDPYEALAYRLHQEFIAKAEADGDQDLIDMAKNDAVGFGIDVLSTFLSYAPAAYLMYVKEAGKEVDMAEFEFALRTSTRVTSMFATTDRRTAATYETDFGVINAKVPTYEQPGVPAFRFEMSKHQVLEFVKSFMTEFRSKAEVYARLETGDLQKLASHRNCPAYYEVIDALWQRGITISLEAPSLYPRDFAFAMAA
jgi:hypothetical protein